MDSEIPLLGGSPVVPMGIPSRLHWRRSRAVAWTGSSWPTSAAWSPPAGTRWTRRQGADAAWGADAEREEGKNGVTVW